MQTVAAFIGLIIFPQVNIPSLKSYHSDPAKSPFVRLCVDCLFALNSMSIIVLSLQYPFHTPINSSMDLTGRSGCAVLVGGAEVGVSVGIAVDVGSGVSVGGVVAEGGTDVFVGRISVGCGEADSL